MTNEMMCRLLPYLSLSRSCCSVGLEELEENTTRTVMRGTWTSWLRFVVMTIGWFISENVNKIKQMFLLNELQSKLYCFWPKTSQDT